MTDPPNPSTDAQSKGWGCGKAFVFVAALLAVAVAMVFIVERPTYEPPTPEQLERQAERQAEREQERAERDAQLKARVLCRYAVEARLRAPSTADWEKAPRVATLAAGRYEVAGWVDAENAFGAKLRNDYRCVVSELRVVEVDIRAR